MDRRGVRQYPAQYRTELLAAIQGIELDQVSRAVDVLMKARAQNRRIFICGNDPAASLASQLLCGLLRSAALNRSARLSVVTFTDQSWNSRIDKPALNQDRVFVEQLKNLVEPQDVIVGVSSSGNATSLVRAFEYAARMDCRTVAISASDGEVEPVADVHLVVPGSNPESVEGSLMIVCHMIGYHCLNFETT